MKNCVWSQKACLLNRLRTGQGQRRSCLVKWGQAFSDYVTVARFRRCLALPFANVCPLMKFDRGFSRLCMRLVKLLPSGSIDEKLCMIPEGTCVSGAFVTIYLWLTMTDYDWLVTMTDYDWLWLIMTDYDWLWLTMTDYDWSWLILTDYDW